MKIIFFTENTRQGGLDSFIVALIRNWPVKEDDLVLMCNRSHPGLPSLVRRLGELAEIIPIDLPLASVTSRRFAAWSGRHVSRMLSPLFSYVSFLFLIPAIEQLFRHCAADRLLVINGGYPAGASCRAATIAWDRVRKQAPRAVHSVHNMAVRVRWWEHFPEWLIDNRVSRATRDFVAVSDACARALEANRPVIGARETTVPYIYNGIDSPISAPSPSEQIRRRLSMPQGTPLCAMLAVYEARKGHAFLIRAWKRVTEELPHAQLLICGDGTAEDRERVAVLVQEAGLDSSVHLWEHIEDVSALLSEVDVLLSASQAFESFGLTLVEAMARRIPVIGTDVGGIPEVIGYGESAAGYVVSHMDHIAYADRVIMLLRDAALRRRLGERGFARYTQSFTADRMAMNYAALVRQAETPRPQRR